MDHAAIRDRIRKIVPDSYTVNVCRLSDDFPNIVSIGHGRLHSDIALSEIEFGFTDNELLERIFKPMMASLEEHESA